MFNLPVAQLLMASIIAGVLGVSGFLLNSSNNLPDTTVRIEPEKGTKVVGETFIIDVVVDTRVSTNVFKGMLTFDSERLAVKTISYNTSIADLWAEEPWYSNGAGTINFIGGTTKSGGFIGTGSLISIEFVTKTAGEATISMSDINILQHDGLGTEVPITTPIDALFSVDSHTHKIETILKTSIASTDIQVIPVISATDLNQDGTHSIVDISIFMTDLITQNKRSDFNQDNAVTFKDLSILTAK